MARLLLTALFSLAPLTAGAVATLRRTVMENLATSNNTIFVSTPNARLGVATSTPATTLDINGTSQFGTTVKSTFSTTGDLTLAVNGDLTLSGPSGFITTKSSITGSAFFGDGSNLTGLSAGGETNTYTSSKTFTANVTMSSSALVSGTLTVSSNVTVAAGSVTASGFFGSGASLTGLPVAQTTVTYNLSGATTETTNFKVCYGTGTLTTGGSAPIVVFYSGDITNSGAAGTYCIINFLQDGAFISPATTLIGMGKSNNAAAGGSGNATTFRIFPAPASGSHSWCISLISPFGTTCTFSTGGAYGNQFGVIELR